MEHETTMTEKSLTAKIVKWLRAQGAWCIKLHGGPYQQAGVPDLFVILRSRAFFLEVKRPGCNPTMLQSHVIGQIAKAGGEAHVVRSLEDVQAIVEKPPLPEPPAGA